jgi:hypothetical protein
VEVGAAPQRVAAHLLRRSLAGRRQAECQPEMPQEQAAPCLRESQKTRKMERRVRRVWRNQTVQMQSVREVVTPVPGLKICSCILRSRVVPREAEGWRRV